MFRENKMIDQTHEAQESPRRELHEWVGLCPLPATSGGGSFLWGGQRRETGGLRGLQDDKQQGTGWGVACKKHNLKMFLKNDIFKSFQKKHYRSCAWVAFSPLAGILRLDLLLSFQRRLGLKLGSCWKCLAPKGRMNVQRGARPPRSSCTSPVTPTVTRLFESRCAHP